MHKMRSITLDGSAQDKVSKMLLNDEEKAMLNGDFGKAKQWAIDHQIKVGAFFDAPDMVAVSQAHMMADPESVGEAGVNFMESIANDGGRVVIPMITDPRGVDLNHYRPLGQTEEMAMIERRFYRRLRGGWHYDDQYLCQLSNHHAAIAWRSCCLWRYWRCDLFKQRLWRPV